MSRYYLLLILMTIFGSFGSYFLKKASFNFTIKTFFKNPYIYIGGLLYFVSALINIIILKYIDYSIVLPLTSMTYIWTLLLSYLLLKEKITKNKIFGILLITLGVILMVL